MQQNSETQDYAGSFDIKRSRSTICRRTVILIKLQKKCSVNPYAVNTMQCPVLVLIPQKSEKPTRRLSILQFLSHYKLLKKQLSD